MEQKYLEQVRRTEELTEMNSQISVLEGMTLSLAGVFKLNSESISATETSPGMAMCEIAGRYLDVTKRLEDLKDRRWQMTIPVGGLS